MISAETLTCLKQSGRRYLLAMRRSALTKFAAQLQTRSGWQRLAEHEEVEVKLVRRGRQHYLLARSKPRRHKERAIRRRQRRGLAESLRKLQARVANGKLKSRDKIQQRVGRLQERYPKARTFVTVDVAKRGKPVVTWTWHVDRFRPALAADGAYVLQSNRGGWTPQEFWETYMQWAVAEKAFRVLKSELCLRPVWPRPKWADLGMNVHGLRSRIMKECHRNTREIIDFAFNMLLGKGGKGAPEIREFADTETLKRYGLITETEEQVELHFAKRHGPKPFVSTFPNRPAEVAWLAREVAKLVDEQHVRPDDILILFDSEKWIQGLDNGIRQACRTQVAFSQPHHHNEKDYYIFKPGKLTMTTVKSAKGYDAYVVFVVGTEQLPVTNEGRAAFYVGCTRARLRLYVSGISGLRTLVDEAKQVTSVLSGGP